MTAQHAITRLMLIAPGLAGIFAIDHFCVTKNPAAQPTILWAALGQHLWQIAGATAAEPQAVQPAIPKQPAVAAFGLRDTDGRATALTDYRDKKAVAVVFIGTQCPLANLYVNRLAELQREFGSKGVQVLAVNSNSQDAPDETAKHAKERQLPFPVLIDSDQKVADLFGAQRTPEAFLLDSAGVVLYRGRIDDQYAKGSDRGEPTRHDLKEAIQETLAGRKVTVAQTSVVGCYIGRAKKAVALPTEITYAKHVAAILQKHCQECHRPGQIGPFSLLNYEQASNWSPTIQEVVQEGRMPPWNADPRHGEFANDRRLPEADRKALLAWIDQGSPKGDDNDLPPARQFTDGWQVGRPDLVLSMKEAFKVPALAPQGGVPYQYFVLETNFTEDMWVQAVEARPGNRTVVHHMVVYVGDKQGAEETADRDILVGYVPGSKASIYPLDLGKRIPKGAKLVLEVHYTANGTEQTDLSLIALVFAKQPPKHEVHARFIVNRDFAIPSGADSHSVKAATTFEKDALVLSLTPHMHLRGKSFQFRAIHPDGRSEILLSVPQYDFNWQHTYILKNPVYAKAGTRIECVGNFDNSANNPNNPDSNVEVRWGEQSWQEMMLGVIGYIDVELPSARKK